MLKKLIILLSICLIFSLSAFGQNKWATYQNARFGYSIAYPADLFEPQGEAGNGDGQVFAGENAEMRVYGSYLLLNKTLLKEYNVAVKERENVSYKLYRKNFFVVSGTENGKIYYRKTMAKSGAFITFSIEYDESESAVYDKITARIVESLK